MQRVAVVHSYNMQPLQKAALRRNGVVVHRRLHPGWLSQVLRGRTGKKERRFGRFGKHQLARVQKRAERKEEERCACRS